MEGCSLCSTIHGNEEIIKNIIAIDDFSEFGGREDIFQKTIQTCTTYHNIHFIKGDAFKKDIKLNDDNKINLYFYDGPHEEIDHYNAIIHFNHMFSDLFILVVDDWNFHSVRKGTERAFQQLNYNIIYKQVLPARYNGDTMQWWNGFFVAVVFKKG